MGQEEQTEWNMNNITEKKIGLSRAESNMRTGVGGRGEVCCLWDRLDKDASVRMQETSGQVAGQERSSFCHVSQHCLPPEAEV